MKPPSADSPLLTQRLYPGCLLLALQVLAEPGDLDLHYVIQGLSCINVIMFFPFEHMILRRHAVLFKNLMYPLRILFDIEVMLLLGIDQKGRHFDPVGVLAWIE